MNFQSAPGATSLLHLVLIFAGLVVGVGCTDQPQPSSQPETQSDPDTLATDSPDGDRVVMFFGDSITAGHGVDEDRAFPALIRKRVDSLGWNFRIVNAGVSGETSAGGLSRIDWALRDSVDVLVIELGGNDGLRGINPSVTRENLAGIIDRARKKYPSIRIVLAGMQLPPNLGHEYTEQFEQIYPSLAREKDVALIPFILEDVGGVDSLMQSDGIHPNPEGHAVMAQTVWQHIKPILQKERMGVSA